MRADEASPRLAEIFSGRRGLFLFALLLAEFGAAVQGIAYSTVLPLIAADLDGFALFGATLAVGSVAAVAMLALAPTILGRFSPRTVLLAATALYVVGASLAVFALDMEWVLAGTVVRGIAAGLLGGFGMGAIGALYDARERPRVFGLFALIWLLPSLVGPALNAFIAQWWGWRWALVWPVFLVLLARLLMARHITAVPWSPHRTGSRFASGLLVAAGLGVGAAGSGIPGAGGVAAFVIGAAVAAFGTVLFLRRGAGRAVGRALVAFALVCATYFGLYELLSLTIIQGLGESVIWSGVAISGGLVAWSIAGLRPMPNARVDTVVVGAALLLIAVLGIVWALQISATGWALAVVIAAAVCAGLGMGLAYPCSVRSRSPARRARTPRVR